MPVHLIDIRLAELAAIESLVCAGKYASVGQFVTVAIRNQVAYEESAAVQVGEHRAPEQEDGGTSLSRSEPGSARSVGTSKNLWSLREWGTQPELSTPEPSQLPLWGQYYRFLPLKFVTRALANLSSNGPQDIGAFSEAVALLALESGDRLRALDSAQRQLGALALSVGFPSGKRDMLKSQARFTAQFIGRVNSRGELDGFLRAMGFADLVSSDGKHFLRLARAGFEFAKIENPVLDLGATKAPLHEREVGFLWDHISRCMEGEAEHMRTVVRLLSAGASRPSDLDAGLQDYYLRWASGGNWSKQKIAVMRAGVTSRLMEMGVVRPAREGVQVSYGLSGNWQIMLG